jgi:hypothetical protein
LLPDAKPFSTFRQCAMPALPDCGMPPIPSYCFERYIQVNIARSNDK